MFAHHEISSKADNNQDLLNQNPWSAMRRISFAPLSRCLLSTGYLFVVFGAETGLSSHQPLGPRREKPRHHFEAQCDFATHKNGAISPPLIHPGSHLFRGGGTGRGISACFITGLPVEAAQPDHGPVGPRHYTCGEALLLCCVFSLSLP